MRAVRAAAVHGLPVRRCGRAFGLASTRRKNKDQRRDPIRRPRQPEGSKKRRMALVFVALGIAATGGAIAWRHHHSTIQVPIPAQLAEFDGQVQAYIKEFMAKAQAAPGEAEAQVRLGLVYAAHRLWPEARTCFANAARLNPKQPLAPYHEAVALAEMGEYDAALAELTQITRDFSTFAPAHHRRGTLLLDKGDHVEAAAAFEKLIKLAPDAASGYAGLGEAKLQARQHAEAVPFLEKAAEKNRTDRMIQFLLGTAYLRSGRTVEAQEHLARGAGAQRAFMADAWSAEQESHGMTIANQMDRALALQESKQPEEGARVLENALKWHPDSYPVMNNLAIMYISMNQYDRARDVLMRAVEKDANRFETFLNLAVARAALQDLDGALEAANRAAALWPKVGQTHLIRANLLKSMGREQEALTAFEEALKYDAENLSIHAGLASLYYKSGRLAEAKEHFGALLRGDPTNLGACVRLCDICIRLGELEEAGAALAKAQRLNPEHHDVLTMLQRLEEKREN